MIRAVLAVIGTVIGLVLLLGFKTHPTGGTAGLPTTLSRPAHDPSVAATPEVERRLATGTRRAARASASREVTGDVADTPYGPVQVQVTETDGKIVRVRAVQLPNDQEHSVEISDFAVPQLIQETLAAQSVSIDMVSGATYTSEGYVASLQSALDKGRVH